MLSSMRHTVFSLSVMCVTQIQRGYDGSNGPCASPREGLHHSPRRPNGHLVGADNRRVEGGLNRRNVDHSRSKVALNVCTWRDSGWVSSGVGSSKLRYLGKLCKRHGLRWTPFVRQPVPLVKV